MNIVKEEYSNVISDRELHKEARKALAFESAAFSKTLGPFGMNTIIEDRTLHHTVTKDGFTVYQNVVIYNRIGRAIARLIQKISGSLNEIVGDGTTSAVVVANELYSLKKLIRKHNVSPKIISEIMKIVSEYLVSKVGACAAPINFPSNAEEKDPDNIVYKTAYDIIHNLAAISLNNDYTRGKLVADIFMSLQDPRNGFINVEVSKSNKTFFDKDRGFEIYRGMTLPEMCTEPDGKTAIYDNPYILLVKGQLMTNDADSLNNVIQLIIGKLDKPLVIVAGGFSQAITETIRQSILAYAERNNKKLPILAIEIDTESSLGKDELLDIEANIGARIITVEAGKNFPAFENADEYLPYLGRCDRITSKMTYTRILGGKIDNAKANFRISEIDKEIELMKSEQHIDNTSQVFRLNRRKAILRNDMMTLYVGGDTLEEKEANADLFDDAVRGCRSAARCGIVPGGNTVVAKVIQFEKIISDGKYDELTMYVINKLGNKNLVRINKLEKIVIDMVNVIQKAYIKSYAIVLNNKFRNMWKSLKIAKKRIETYSTHNLVSEENEFFWLTFNYETGLKDYMSSARVINSADTDIRILIAATSIIDLIITSNQFLRIPETKMMQKNM